MSKGAIATLDLVFALAIASVFILSFLPPIQSNYPNVAKVRSGYDILYVLDKQEKLDTMDMSTINATLAVILPSNIDAEININCYNYCEDINQPCEKQFYETQNLNFGVYNTQKSEELNNVKRIFLIENEPTEYCVANMEMWYR